MVNDYSTFILEVSKTIGEDSLGEEIRTILYTCRVTLYSDQLVVEDNLNIIHTSDFTTENVGLYGKKYSINFDSLTIPLGVNITEEDELNLSFYGDCGNYEEGGGGRFALNPTSVEEINREIISKRNVKLDIISNPVIDEEIEFIFAVKLDGIISNSTELTFAIKDYSGKTIRAWQEKANSTEQKKSIGISNLQNGIYLLTMKVGNKEFARKFIVQNSR